MEEILLALGLKSILSMILPIVVIIALIMIVSRLGDIRDDLKKIKKNIKSFRSREEIKDTYESFDRNLSMSDEEKAIEKAKNELFEHLQKAPEYDEWEKWRTIGGCAIIIFFAYWIIIPESYLGFWSWIRWIVFLLLVGFFVFVGFSMRGEDWEDYERKLKRWERKEKKLQKNLNDLRK
tara:strand:- start:9 stop:545 length:537 start_codon:yes stop_codon:yes gene_type:complete